MKEDDAVWKFMTPREVRRSRPIDIARAYQRMAHAANPMRLQSTFMPLEIGQPVRRHVPAERAAQLDALGKAAAARRLRGKR